MDTTPLNYSQARKDLNEIMKKLESPEVDVDLLDSMVVRAAGLIRFCRQRIYQVRMRVEKVLADLEKDGQENGLTGNSQAEEEGSQDIPF